MFFSLFAGGKGQNTDWAGELEKMRELAAGKDCAAAEAIGRRLPGSMPENEWEGKAEVAYWMVICAAARSEDSAALAHLLRADSLISRSERPPGVVFARIRGELGRQLYRQGDDPVLVKRHLESALDVWLRLPGRDSAEMAGVMEYLGKNASLMGEYSRALDLLGQARRVRQLISGARSTPVALVDMHTGNTYYRMDRLPEALSAYQNALSTIRKVEPGRTHTIASLLNNIAAVEDQMQQYPAAIDNYLEALYLTRSYYGESHINTIMTFGNIGLVYQRMGNHAEAERYLGKASGMASKMPHTDPKTGQIYGDHAYVLAENGKYERALGLLGLALEVAAPGFQGNDRSGWKEQPGIGEVVHHELFRNTITYKAEILTRMADTASRPTPYLLTALECYDLFAASVDQVWQDFSDPGDKLYLNKNGFNEYERAIRCAARLRQVTGEERWLDKIFEFMERGKCQVMLESIRRGRAAYLAEIPESLRERGTRLRQEVYDLAFRRNERDEDSSQLLRATLLEKRLELDRFVDSLNRVFPGYARFTGQRTQVSPAAIQEQFAGPETCVIEYFLGDSSLYVVAISASGITFRETPLPRVFPTGLRRFFSLVQYPHPSTRALNDFRRLGYQLYGLLLEPELAGLPSSVRRLRIIPDGLLSLLPFDALISGPGPEHPRNHGELPLLIFDYQISYAGSAALLAGAPQDDQGPAECLGFAWNDPGPAGQDAGSRHINGQDWSPLPGAGREMARIRRLVRGSYFAGDAATETRFKELSGQYGLLHLALHGNSGGEEPFILFPAPGDSVDDGILYLHELYNLPLRARLAVLSACETGSGALQRGEGVMSVASGFGTAGCPAVVMSVWPVDDQAGSRIMQNFYEGIVDGQPVDEALRQAKLAFIRSGGSYHSAPYYWAPFIALGDMAAIPVSRNGRGWGWWIAGGVLLSVLLGGGYWWRTRRRS